MEFNLGRAMAITQRLREEYNLVSVKAKRLYNKTQNVNMLSADLIDRFVKVFGQIRYLIITDEGELHRQITLSLRNIF